MAPSSSQMMSLKLLSSGSALDKYRHPSLANSLRFRAYHWTSLLDDCLENNEGEDLQAAYVGRLNQSEAKKEAGPLR